MDEHKLLESFRLAGATGILIALVIVTGFIAIFVFNYYVFTQNIHEEILDISKLTSISIFSEINNELTKPTFVSLTMANDSFVKDWLVNEQNGDEKEISSYLEGIREKYGYSSTFLVSANSLKYYSYDGLFKTISKDVAHDVWYFQFLGKNRLIDLDVDHDEVDSNILTLFVNCMITDKENTLLGVTGVGIRIDMLQALLSQYEESFQLEAFLIDDKGIVQVHTDASRFGSRVEPSVSLLLTPEKGKQTVDRTLRNSEYIISYFIENLDWYLIVRKDITTLQKEFRIRTYFDIAIFLLIALSVLLIVLRLIRQFRKKTLVIAQTDPLTGLLNRRGFDTRLKELVTRVTKPPFSVYLYDVDYFKKINDQFGHLQGDKVLKRIVSVFQEQLPGALSARWGGDEFVGLLTEEREDVFSKLETVRKIIETDTQLKEYAVTISIGMVSYAEIDTEESLMRKADKALYLAKENGRNRVCVW
jgi:diguanylate cyclase (GGDEF)-like protein